MVAPLSERVHLGRSRARLSPLTPGPLSRSPSPSLPQGSAESPGLGASRLLTSHWSRAPRKWSRGGTAVQLRGRHLGGKFGGRAVGGAERGEVPGVGRLEGERASGIAGWGEWGGGGRGGGRGSGGAAAEGSSSPVPSLPSAELLEPRAGRGDVERGRVRKTPRVGPGRTPSPSARCSQKLCGGAAGVGARGGVHVGREGVAESGRCPVRPRWSSPEEASEEKGKREEGAQAGQLDQPSWFLSERFTAAACLGA